MADPKKRRREWGDQAIDMTPMIDVVFQLIIFFIVTVNLDQELLKPIELTMTPNAPPIVEKDPRTVTITVDRSGVITIGSAVFGPRQLQGVMQNVYNVYGSSVPVLIRGDGEAIHQHVRQAMDACAAVGIWKIKVAGLKEKAAL